MGAMSDLAYDIDQALKGYVIAMLWANAVCNQEGCADAESGSDCTHTRGAGDYEWDDVENLDKAREDVESMILSNLSDFRRYEESNMTAQGFGHDFALTRNGHGAGFWDRGLGDLGDRLTAASKTYGEASVFVDDESAAFES